MTTQTLTLLIVDDDAPLRGRLTRVMERRGFEVFDAEGVQDARTIIESQSLTHAVLDMKLEDGNGLDVVKIIKDKQPDCRIIMLTGFGNIATAVAAVKAGAVDYLPKPADPEAIAAALLQQGSDIPPPPEDPMSADRVRWEHIQRVYEQCGRNVSETARRLKLHRRTLQRILAKHAPRP
ncbi:MAG: ActR/PrrA/RegA family redox response regulator transcription factor [Alphaproteobacteria bacterium]|nr:ActR/PrrA/RegA family redox response regulator transcription factor [Alphaproteobacteria bacterium]